VLLEDRPCALPSGRWTWLTAHVRLHQGRVMLESGPGDKPVVSAATDATAIRGRITLEASTDIELQLDELEVIGTARLARLPRPSERHDVDLVFDDESEPLLRASFLASRYLDLRDHLDSWDRQILPAPAAEEGGGSNHARLLAELGNWLAASSAARDAGGGRMTAQRERRRNNRSLSDEAAADQDLQTKRYVVDEAFGTLRRLLGLEIASPPRGMEVWRSSAGSAILLRSPEPVAWSRVSAGRPVPLVNGVAGEPLNAQLVASSDFTESMLILRGTAEHPYPVVPFQAGTTYLWPIRQYDQLPSELEWLRGWFGLESFNLRLEI
jgi:hypothetical protein